MPVINSSEKSNMCATPTYILRAILIIIFCVLNVPSWSQSAPSAYTTGFRYDAAHRLVGVIKPDPDGAGAIRFAASRNSYDARGVLVTEEVGQLSDWQSEDVSPSDWTGFAVFRRIFHTYDGYGRELSRQTSSGGAAYTLKQFSYDNSGRVECAVTRMNRAAFSAAYNLTACQLGAEGDDGPDRIERITYDASDRPLTVARAYGTPLQQAYATKTYVNAHLASDRDANGNLTTYQVDGFGRLEYWYFPSKTATGQSSSTDFEKYSYDENDNRKQLKKRDGNTIYYSYDALDRVTSKDLPGTTSDVTLGYDLRGLETSATFTTTGLGIANGYDAFGHLTFSTTNVSGTTRSISYSYDANGNRSRMNFPDGAHFDYAYDGLDRMVRICENEGNCESSASPVITISYDAKGRRDHMTRGGAVSETSYGYDDISRLTSLTQDLDGPATGSDVNQSFSFNAANQVVNSTVSNISYAFSPSISNRTYSANGLNQYTQISSPAVATFTYDANGNLTSDGATTYGYDSENHLVSASGTQNVTFSYDPRGRLVQTSGSVVTQFLYDGDKLIAEYSSTGGVQRRYVHGPDVDEALIAYEGSTVGVANRRYLHANYQGSVIAVVGNTGATLEKITYDPYGVTTNGSASRFQYTGQVYVGELKLYYYKARFYNPELGRFMQVDPIGYEDEMNLYAYVNNDPANRRDPSGKADVEILPEIVVTGTRLATTTTTTMEEIVVTGTRVATPELVSLLALPLLLVTPSNGWVGSDEIKCRDETVCIAMMAEKKGEKGFWGKLKSFRGKTKTNGEAGKKRRYFEKDRTHGDLEVYDSDGKHLGSADPETGNMTKPAVPGRKIDL